MVNRGNRRSQAVADSDVQELQNCGHSAALPVHKDSTTADTCGKSRWDSCKGDWGIQGSLEEVCQGTSWQTEPASPAMEPARKTQL